MSRAYVWVVVLALGLSGAFDSPVSAQGKRSGKAPPKLDVKIETKEGVPPLYRTRNFAVQTDITPEEAQHLMVRLETMLVLISKYWGRPNAQSIDMYVIRDPSKWTAMKLDPDGLQSALSGGGVTMSQGLQNRQTGEIFGTRAVVYATADHGTPQHEAVHAYCALNFGRTGPTWYSEGMAEMGQYWREKDPSVNCHPEVVKYLKSQEPKLLTEITDLGQRTGDNWQNYAWRWALCNLLANNTNYAPRFHPLGMALLNAQKSSFEDVYGPMAKEISFEYVLFLKNFDLGYRVDLCSWDWTAKFSGILTRPLTAKVKAAAGWQAGRLFVKKGESYRYSTKGTWALSKDGEKLTAHGIGDNASRLRAEAPAAVASTGSSAGGQDDSTREPKPLVAGAGKLEAVIFHDYELSDPIELGEDGTFKAEVEGKLFLRCRDEWSEIADNTGEITVKFEKAE